jgi:hypothetical protein
MIVIERDFDKTDNILFLQKKLARELIFKESAKVLGWLVTSVGPLKSKRSRHKCDFGLEHNWEIEVANMQHELGFEKFPYIKELTSIYCYSGKGWKYYVTTREDQPLFANEYKTYIKFDNDALAVQYKLTQYK